MRHFLLAVRGIMLKGMPFGMAFDAVWPLAIITVVILALAGWFFRKGLE